MDGTGERRKGVLTAHDLATWRAHWEEPLTLDYGDWTLCKTGPWSQGLMMLQSLQLLKHAGIADMQAGGVDFVHTVIEAMKLAMPTMRPIATIDFFDIPMAQPLSDDYAAQRSALITDAASLHDQRPGVIAGLDHLARPPSTAPGATAT
ncbi:MAG: gamma-glutamyltransferase [Paracoccaceae bacterium]